MRRQTTDIIDSRYHNTLDSVVVSSGTVTCKYVSRSGVEAERDWSVGRVTAGLFRRQILTQFLHGLSRLAEVSR